MTVALSVLLLLPAITGPLANRVSIERVPEFSCIIDNEPRGDPCKGAPARLRVESNTDWVLIPSEYPAKLWLWGPGGGIQIRYSASPLGGPPGSTYVDFWIVETKLPPVVWPGVYRATVPVAVAPLRKQGQEGR